MKWMMTGFFVLFMMMAAYNKGLYYDRDFYGFQLVLCAITILTILYLMIRGEIRKHIKGMLLLGVCFLYLLPLVFTAESVSGTLDQMLRWAGYGCFLFLIYLFCRKADNRILMETGLQLVGWFIVVSSFAGWFGWLDFADVVQRFQDDRLSSTGVRLAGFLQYANSFGAIMAAFWLYHLMRLVREQKGWVMRLILLPIPLYGAALLLSESRGAWLSFGLGWMVGLCLLNFREQVRYLLASMVTGGAALAIYGALVFERGSGNLPIPGLALLLLAVLLSAAILIALHKVSGRWKLDFSSSRMRWLIPGMVAGSSCLLLLDLRFEGAVYRLLPEALQDRLSLQNLDTIFARGYMYEDAWAMIRQSPLIGYGGDAWKLLFGSYQQMPYVGNEVHSGYLDLMLQVGFLGFLVLLGILIYYFIGASSCPWIIPPLVVLLGHSAIDIDLSYGFIWFLILWLIGTGLILEKNSKFSFSLIRSERIAAGGRLAGIIIVILLLCAAFWQAVRFDRGEQAYANAQAATRPDVAQHFLQATVGWNPYDAAYRIELARSMPMGAGNGSRSAGGGNPGKQLEVLMKGLDYEPHHPLLHWESGLIYLELSDTEKGLSHLDQAVLLDRYDAEKHEAYLRLLVEQMRVEEAGGNRQSAVLLADKAVKVFERYEGLSKELEFRQSSVNDRNFTVTQKAIEYARQAAEFKSKHGK